MADCAASWVPHPEILADLARKTIIDLVVTWNGASYRNIQLFVSSARGLTGFIAIHFQRFHQRDSQGLQQLGADALLAIDAQNFLDPANPPRAAFPSG